MPHHGEQLAAIGCVEPQAPASLPCPTAVDALPTNNSLVAPDPGPTHAWCSTESHLPCSTEQLHVMGGRV